MPESPRYTIRTLQDMGQIPVGRIDAFLVDLKSCLLLGHGLSDMSDSFVKGIDPDLSCPCVPNEITWVDDGANDLLALTVEGDENLLPQPIKHEHIAGMVDGMHQFAKHISAAGNRLVLSFPHRITGDEVSLFPAPNREGNVLNQVGQVMAELIDEETERCRAAISAWLDIHEVDHLAGPELDATVRQVLEARQ